MMSRRVRWVGLVSSSSVRVVAFAFEGDRGLGAESLDRVGGGEVCWGFVGGLVRERRVE